MQTTQNAICTKKKTRFGRMIPYVSHGSNSMSICTCYYFLLLSVLVEYSVWQYTFILEFTSKYLWNCMKKKFIVFASCHSNLSSHVDLTEVKELYARNFYIASQKNSRIYTFFKSPVLPVCLAEHASYINCSNLNNKNKPVTFRWKRMFTNA